MATMELAFGTVVGDVEENEDSDYLSEPSGRDAEPVDRSLISVGRRIVLPHFSGRCLGDQNGSFISCGL